MIATGNIKRYPTGWWFTNVVSWSHIKQWLWPWVFRRWWAAPPHRGELSIPGCHWDIPAAQALSLNSCFSPSPPSQCLRSCSAASFFFSATLEPAVVPQGSEVEAVWCHTLKGRGALALDTGTQIIPAAGQVILSLQLCKWHGLSC